MKKAPIAVALVLVFGLFTAAFSLAPAVAQYTPPSDSTSTNSTGASTGINQTSSANTTTSTTTNATGGEIFSARGSITTMIFDTGETTTTSEVLDDATTAGNDTSMTGNTTTFLGNATTTTMPQIVSGDNGTSSSNLTDMTSATSAGKATSDEPSTAAEELQPPYVASGDWSLDVKDDSVSDFAANFTMVHIYGTGRHTQDFNQSSFWRQQKYPSFLLVQQHWTVVFEKEKIFKIVRLANPDEPSAGVRPVDQVGHCHCRYHHYERL